MTPKTTERHSADTVQKILSAAEEIFANVGYAGARVDEIARKAKVNKATIYYHIGGKAKLYETVLARIFGQSASDMIARIEEVNGHEEKIGMYIRTIAQTIENNPYLPQIMMREIAAGGKNLPEAVAENLVRMVDILTGIIEQGQKDGHFIEINPFYIHMSVIATFVFYKASAPIRSHQPAFPDAIKNLGDAIGEPLIETMEKMILKGISL